MIILFTIVMPPINYGNLLLLDAKILRPEYGVEKVTDENGQLEKIETFARATKTHVVSPMLLPEPVVDALAQMSTFDYVELCDGDTQDLYYLLSGEDLPVTEKSINSFDMKPQWETGDIYATVDLSFEENLAILDKCCDAEPDPFECCTGDDANYVPVIAKSQHANYVTLSITGEDIPTCLKGSFVYLYWKKTLYGDFTNCDAVTGLVDSSLYKSYTDFVANGFKFDAFDLDTYIYTFQLLFKSMNCDTENVSENVCSDVVV